MSKGFVPTKYANTYANFVSVSKVFLMLKEKPREKPYFTFNHMLISSVRIGLEM